MLDLFGKRIYILEPPKDNVREKERRDHSLSLLKDIRVRFRVDLWRGDGRG